MISAEDLAQLVTSYNPKSNSDMIIAAYNYGREKHEGQFRKSGEPYFTHPVAVAVILAKQKLDDASIITGLLHDTIEDTESTKQEIASLFSPEIAMLVDGVTNLTKMQLGSTATKEAENTRKLLMAIAKDMRVMLVKLADRLHNMSTIRAMTPEKQAQKARETMDIFAPLAGRMGMQSMREELEDLAFRVLNPDGRTSILRRFITLQKEAGDVVENISTDMRHELAEAGIDASVYGRAKKPYSIWRKMQEKELSFSRLSDIYGFRIITKTEADCYRVLGVIHQRWRAVPGRFKDYISQPKSNGYRSIHTTVKGRDGKQVEVQMRTQQMHDVAETGVAAHWSYKDGARSENPFTVDPVRWIRDLIEQFDTEEDPTAFLEAVKLEMYADKVFCFTPKGKVIKLPRGATPIDFAYAIHTRIGHKTVGAKVDGLRYPLYKPLRNGQTIEVITAEGQQPHVDWLEMVATGKAKTAINRSIKEQVRARFIAMGREYARAAFEHVDKKATDKALATASKKLSYATVDDMMVDLGANDIRPRDVVHAVYSDLAADDVESIDKQRAVIGLAPGQEINRDMCCQPLPGERIVGIKAKGKGVVVHAIDCEILELFQDRPHKWLDLHWQSGKHSAIYDVTLAMTISNDAGVLGRICTLIGEQQANISDLEFMDRRQDFYTIHIDVDLRDIEHFHSVISALEAESEVTSVDRLRKPEVVKDLIVNARS